MFYDLLILTSVVIVFMSFYNLYKAAKIEKNLDNYLFIITSQKNYYIGAVIFSLAMLIIAAYQALPYGIDKKIFSIILFFLAVFLLSLSHFIYYYSAKKKLNDYKEYFKQFEIDLNNKCEKMMLKYIYSKEKDLAKVKEIFKINKELCKDKK
ncbi:conserved hypothetical protein [Lebetimonas natsushimae]|uniref:Uncharacterized protein n=1 Tax=Lebetimonas natsushimae TaxID=1936991 RepID=A0A292YFP8_9BACT|nr:adenylate kinase [Lebetimonas natsushimae]GAX88228.1 conserved hypothetical protein [Lebetimonas natsushimae]